MNLFTAKKCWFGVTWLKGIAVIKTRIQDDVSPAISGEMLFPGFCHDPCEEASPINDKTVYTCGETILLSVSVDVSVLKVLLKCKNCGSRNLRTIHTFIQTNDKVSIYITKDVTESSYELDILTSVDAVPQDLYCKYSQEVYIICDSTDIYIAPSSTTVIPPTLLNVHSTIGVIVGLIILITVVLITITLYIRKRRLAQRTERLTERQSVPLNNQQESNKC